MVTSADRRQATCWLQREFGVSERRACATTGSVRSTQRYSSRRQSDHYFRARLRAITLERPRFGYRRVHAIVPHPINETPICINHAAMPAGKSAILAWLGVR